MAELAEVKSIRMRYAPPYAPHLNTVEHCFDTIRHLPRSQQAWTEDELTEALKLILKLDSFSKESMTKLFTSVIWGNAKPGTRARHVPQFCWSKSCAMIPAREQKSLFKSTLKLATFVKAKWLGQKKGSQQKVAEGLS